MNPWFIVEDVNRFKVHHSSQSSKQTGDACDKKKIGDAVVKNPSSQECHQMTENDGIPEEVSDRKKCLFHKA